MRYKLLAAFDGEVRETRLNQGTLKPLAVFMMYVSTLPIAFSMSEVDRQANGSRSE